MGDFFSMFKRFATTQLLFASSRFSASTFGSPMRWASSKSQKYPIYELRWYTIAPEHFPAFLKLTNEKIHMRTSHSPVLGYWTAELGGLNQVVHIWGYESLVQRQQIRNALGGDNKWNDEYMAVMRPMLQGQENAVMLPSSEIKESFPDSDDVDLPAYELEVLAEEDEQSKASREKFGGQLVGSWLGVVGTLNGSTIRVWRYPSLETLDSSIRVGKGPLDSQQFNKIMLPTAFSPLY